ncbi:MAG: class I SAM-dependent methyltransferase [Gammaproteobacteria bacterium]|nr:class I SAM-dependent methyltransferase [Gammaproteobacteria bacterium]MDH5512828.1 class I SAM-dependent methyltransferase [Gammaproteobacteria bacterium]
MIPFGDYARYYDLLYRDKDYRGEAVFIENIIGDHVPRARRILELGCGTGAHGIILAERGFDVVGVDISDRMIDIAKRRTDDVSAKIAQRIRFVCGDARDYISADGKFDAVIALFHVASYQHTNDDLRAMFATAKANLAPSGIFVFDCWYGPAVLTERPVVRKKQYADENISLTRIATPTHLPDLNRVDVEYELQVQDLRNKKTEKIVEIHRMRYLFRPELEVFSKNAGLHIVSTGEWMTNREPGLSTWSVYFVLKQGKN